VVGDRAGHEALADTGVDGFRLDDPYLCEREAPITRCPDPRHHQAAAGRSTLRQGKVLLAEANQPGDVDISAGDEYHGLYFPLMPRIYMAIAQEFPITVSAADTGY
jgi:hypothetical protein